MTSAPAKKGQLVPTEHVNDLVSNYKKHRWLDNSNKLGKPDALSTWYGLEELQNFLKEAAENKADGIKMFYGVYPPDYPNELIAGRQTIVLVATRKAENHPGARNKAILVNKSGSKSLLAFNYGESCPPFCGGTPPDYDIDLSLETDNIGQVMIEKNGNLEII
ncbi:MAG: hypothetical protein ACN4EP_12670 [Sediminibacterium sp.]